MNDDTNPARVYGGLSIALHWIMLLLIAAVFLCIELREDFPRGDPTRAALKAWHFTLGLTVFALVWVRLAARHFTSRKIPARRWDERLAKVMHLALYAVMIGMPLLGWMALSADGKPIPFFGLELPPLIGPDKALAHDLEEVHETIGEIAYWLIGLHAAAALVHHYALKDDILARMLPRRAG